MEKTCYQTHWCSDVETDSTIAATAASPSTSVINCASIFGAFTDSSGNIMIITPESMANSAAITVVIQNSVGTVIGSDTGSFTAPTITLSVARRPASSIPSASSASVGDREDLLFGTIGRIQRTDR